MTRVILTALLVASTAMGAASSQRTADQPLLFVADLRGEHVAPAAVASMATGRATAVLTGSRLTVHGSFTALSSALRDIEKTPDDPGVHLHRGAPGETTPYFFGLRVQLNADGRSGVFFGSTELDAEQRAALLSNRMYVDIHTVQHGPGEVRDQWHPADPAGAARVLASLGGDLGDGAVTLASIGSCH